MIKGKLNIDGDASGWGWFIDLEGDVTLMLCGPMWKYKTERAARAAALKWAKRLGIKVEK